MKTSRRVRPKIKVQKLIFELVIVLLIILAIIASKILPQIWDQPVLLDNASNRYYLELVRSYDFSRSPDMKLENKLKKEISNEKITPEHRFYNRAALIEYYIGYQRYDDALEILAALNSLLIDNPVRDKYTALKYAECYKGLGDDEKYDEMMLIYNNNYINVPDSV